MPRPVLPPPSPPWPGLGLGGSRALRKPSPEVSTFLPLGPRCPLEGGQALPQPRRLCQPSLGQLLAGHPAPCQDI